MPHDPEYEQAIDNLEDDIDDLEDYEVSDLPDNEEDGEVDRLSLPRSYQRRSLQPRISQQQRRVQAAATGGVILITLVVLLTSIAPVRDMFTSTLFNLIPTPPPTVVGSAESQFYVVGVPSWSQLFIDGEQITNPPRRVWIDKPLQLAPGNHAIEFVAPPFVPQGCIVSVPRQLNDTCNNGHSDLGGADTTGARLIIPNFSLDRLPADQRTALKQAAQEALNRLQATSQLKAGEYYINHDTLSTARQPLQATLQFRLDTTDTSNSCILQHYQYCIHRAQDYPSVCYNFCTEAREFAQVGQLPQGWLVDVVVQTRWSYTAPTGQVLVQNQADGVQDREHVLRLYINWDGQSWQVTVAGTQPDSSSQSNPLHLDPACQSARDGLYLQSDTKVNQSLLFERRSAPLGSFAWRFASGPNPADGCLALLNFIPGPSGGQTIPLPHNPILLHHFGVYLAVNEEAHRFFPNLPLADASEQQLAHQLLQNLTQ